MIKRARLLIACAILAEVIVLALSPLAGSRFQVYDDDLYLTGNPFVRGGLTVEALRWDFTTFRGGNWIPLSWLSHQVVWSLFGAQPLAHHLANLLLHGVNCLLLFLLLHRLTASFWKSALVAALFGIHPLHVESVAWVSERKDLLCASFWLLSLMAYRRYAARPSRYRFGVLLAAYAASLMAKPMAVTLPFVLLLLDFWPLARWRVSRGGGAAVGSLPRVWGRLAAEKTPLLLMAVAASITALLAQRAAGATEFGGGVPLAVRCANALLSYGWYLRQTILPTGLAVFYPYPAAIAPTAALAAALLLAAVTAAALRWRSRWPFLLTGWLWYLGMLVPVIGVIQVGSQSRADRYTYLPLIGVFVVLAWGGEAATAARKGLGKIAAVAAAGLIAALGCLAFRQAGYWRNSVTLFSHALAVTGSNVVAHNNLGSALLEAGRSADARGHFEAALRHDPKLATARASLGVILLQEGKPEQAVRVFEDILREDASDYRVHAHLGNVLLLLGRTEEAIRRCGHALELSPGNPHVLACLAGATAVRARTAPSWIPGTAKIHTDRRHPGGDDGGPAAPGP